MLRAKVKEETRNTKKSREKVEGRREEREEDEKERKRERERLNLKLHGPGRKSCSLENS